MATSGTTTYNLSVQELIDDAFEIIEKDPQTLEGYSVKTARRSLNQMLALWSTKGISYWTTEETTLSLTQGTSEYNLPEGTIDVLDAVIRRSNTDTTCTRIALSDYHALPNKTAQGLPTQFFFDRQTTPKIRLWQTPENSTDTFVYWRLKRIEDVTAGNQDINLPVRWYEAAVLGLAERLALKYNKAVYETVKVAATEAFTSASDDENERATLRIIPARVV